MRALRSRERFAKDTVLIVDGTLVPARDHTIATQSGNYRYSTNHQVVIDADTRLAVVVAGPRPATTTTAGAWEESGARAAVGRTTTIADGGCPGTGLLMPTEDAQAKTSRTGSKRTTRPASRSAPASSTSSPA